MTLFMVTIVQCLEDGSRGHKDDKDTNVTTTTKFLLAATRRGESKDVVDVTSSSALDVVEIKCVWHDTGQTTALFCASQHSHI